MRGWLTAGKARRSNLELEDVDNTDTLNMAESLDLRGDHFSS